MKRARIIVYGSILLLVVSGYYLLRPTLWEKTLLDTLNDDYLKSSGWAVKTDEVSGHALSMIRVDQLELTHQNGNSITLDECSFRLNPISFFFGKTVFSTLYVGDIYIRQRGIRPASTDSDEFRLYPERMILPMSIKGIMIKGNITVDTPGDMYLLDMDIQGSILSENNSTLIAIKNMAVNELTNQHSVKMDNAFIKISPNSVTASFERTIIDDFAIDGTVSYFEDKVRHLQGNVDVVDYHIPRDFFSQIPLSPEISSLNMHCSFNTDFSLSHGIIQVESPLGLDMNGDFLLEKQPDYFRLHQLSLKSDDSEMLLKGIVENSGRINGSMEMANIDISQWLESNNPTSVSGLALLEGSVTDQKLTSVSISTEIQDTSIYEGESLSISGSMAYNDQRLTITDPVSVHVGNSSVEVSGWSDFFEQTLNIHFELKNASPFLLNNFWSDILQDGMATGLLDVEGSFDAPDVNADVDFENLVYRDYIISSGTIEATVQDVYKLDNGFIHLSMEDGIIQEQHVDNGIIDIQLSPDWISLEQLHMNDGPDYIEINGRYDRNTKIEITRLQMAYQSHFLVNPSDAILFWTDSLITILPFELHVDDGVLEGTGTWTDSYNGILKFSGINSEIVRWILPENISDITGTLFGEVSVSNEDRSPEISVDLSIKNGSIKAQDFQDVYISCVLKDSVLHIDDISMVGEKTGFQLSGTIPSGFPDKTTTVPMSFESNFTHVDMEWFLSFMPPWFDIKGSATGDFSFSSFGPRTTFNFDVNIENTMFDLIHLGTVKGDGAYDGNRLNYHAFSSERQNGDRIHGKGYLPIDYTPGSPSFGSYKEGEPIFIESHGSFNNMDFLTNYLTDVDSIRGKIGIDLYLTGTPEHMIRNGSMQIRNGMVYSLLVNDPITNVNGAATLKDNQYQFETLTGSMLKNTKSTRDNLTILGGMDMTRFFSPDFNLKVIGEEIYIDAIEYDIEGRVNSDLHIMGRDTITITGNVGLIDMEMFQEFSDTDLGDIESSSTVYVYRINMPIIEQFSLLNSQMDATLIGEIGYTQEGNQEADWAGELQFIDGKFYFYSDIFDITYGYLAFDNNGFNPYMEIEAITSIDDEEITLNVIGTPDNLQINPTSTSGYSESDIFELLMMGVRFDELETNATGFGVQAQQFLGSWLASEIERNLANIGGVGGIVDDVSISGATGLIDPGMGEELSIKAGLTDNLSFAYKRSFSLGSYSNEVGVELKVNRYFSLVGNVDENDNFTVKYRLRYSY